MNENTFCIEDVSCYLNTTGGLLELLIEKCLNKDKKSVTTRGALKDLISNHIPTYNLVRDYGCIVDCVHILHDRIERATEMLESIIKKELKNRDRKTNSN